MLMIDAVRRWNARYLADQMGGVMRFAERIGRSQSQVSQVIGKRPIKKLERVFCAHIETEFGLSPGWLDVPHLREWAVIHDKVWADALRVELAAAGVSLDVSGQMTEHESEILTIYNLLPPPSRLLLLEIARLVSGHAVSKS